MNSIGGIAWLNGGAGWHFPASPLFTWDRKGWHHYHLSCWFSINRHHFLCYHSGTMNRSRLIPYLFLNVLVSVLVSGAVLYFYDRANQNKDCSPVATVPTLSSVTISANILSVSGAGALGSESVLLQNNGLEPIILTGWTLKNVEGSSYIFPQLTLYPGGTVQVHSGSGTDTAADLYWGLSSPVWKSGELVASLRYSKHRPRILSCTLSD